MQDELTQQRMVLAIEAARLGIQLGQSPFGAAIFDPAGELVVADHNRVRAEHDPTAHAEIVAIRKACHRLGHRSLKGHALFATCEPCPMCAAAIVFAGITEIYFGASVADAISAGFIDLQIPCGEVFNQAEKCPRVLGGILRDRCSSLLQEK